MLSLLCLLLAASSLLALLARRRRIRRLTAASFDRLDRHFKRCEEPKWNSYEVSRAIVEAGGKKPFKRGYLLIGGFGDVPILWKSVVHNLSENGSQHFFLCPRTPGWGRSHFDEAQRVTWQEWSLAARDSLSVVSALCEHITVCGHSTGALVAANIASVYEVDRLVFTAPNFVSNPGDLWAKQLLLGPMGGLVSFVLGGVVPKKLRGERPIDSNNSALYENGWYLSSFPLNKLRQMWRLQDEVKASTSPWRVKESVLLVMGEQDQSVGPLEAQLQIVTPLVPAGVKLSSHIIEEAAHGLPAELPEIVNQLCQYIADG